jgi:hypothetical protein
VATREPSSQRSGTKGATTGVKTHGYTRASPLSKEELRELQRGSMRASTLGEAEPMWPPWAWSHVVAWEPTSRGGWCGIGDDAHTLTRSSWWFYPFCGYLMPRVPKEPPGPPQVRNAPAGGTMLHGRQPLYP